MKLHLAIIFLPLLAAAQPVVSTDQAMITFVSIQKSLSNNNASQAITEFEELMSYESQTGAGENLAERYFGMALALALNGDYRESIQYHRKALKAHRRTHHEHSLEIKINLGLTYQLAGRDRKARRILGELYESVHFREEAS